MRRVVLNVHGIGDPLRPLEVGEDRYWISEDFYSSVLDLADRLSSETDTTFTFDDGNLSDATIGARELDKRGRRGTFFLLTGRLNTPGSLKSEHVTHLARSGHEIGNHGADHVNWRRLDAAAAERELESARDHLSELSGKPVISAGVPFGEYDRSVLKALSARGYEKVFSSDGGIWSAGANPIPRTSLRADMTIDDVEDLLSGREAVRYRLRRMASRAKKKLF